MKKRTIRILFWTILIIGIVIGWLLPGDISLLTKKADGKKLDPNIFDIPKKFGQLDVQGKYFRYSILAEAETGSVELLRVDERIPLHKHPNENHFVYIYKGKAKGTIGDVTAEVGPGQLIVIPAGIPHSIERIGDTPLEIILFSTPPFVQKDTVFLEEEQ